MTLRIIQIQPEIITDNRLEAASYFLESADGRWVPYRAGQFLTLILPHLSGSITRNNPEVRRSYSISSAPNEKRLRLTIKRVQNGEISRYLLDTLRVGDVLMSLPPAGRFTVDDRPAGDLILFGAGSGITPLFAMLKQFLFTQSASRVTLLYSSPDEHTCIFRNELDELHRQFIDRFRLIYLWTNPTPSGPDSYRVQLPVTVRSGRLNNVMLDRLLPELLGESDRNTIQFYVCGPADYMRMVQFTLVVNGIGQEQIRRENFTVVPVTLMPPPAIAQERMIMLQLPMPRYGENTEPEKQEITIRVAAYKSILQAALDAGISLPYSCRGGRCSTCAARCLSGSVYMTINDVLTARDLADGWILTCTGYPESDDVVIAII